MANAPQEAEDGATASSAPADAGAHSDAPSTGPSRLTFVGIYAYSAALALMTALLLVQGPLAGTGPVRVLIPQPAMFAVVCVLWAAVFWVPVSLHHRGNTILLFFEEVPLTLGLVFLSPSLLVLACVGAVAFIFKFVRKQSFYKLFFNMASGGLSAVLAAIVFRAILGSHSAVSLWCWLAAVPAVCFAALVMNATVVLMARLLGQTTERRTAPQIFFNAVLTTASVCLAFVVLDAALLNVWAMAPVLLVGGLLIAAYRGYTRLSLRFASLQRLYDFSRALGTTNLEPTSMSVEMLGQVCTVMRARRAQLILAEPDGIPRRIALDEHGELEMGPIGLAKSSIITQAIESGEASLHTTATSAVKSGVDPVVGRYVHAIVAPIVKDHTAIGAVAAIDRDEELDGFDEDDLRLFETLVTHATANLERARLVEELRYEVDSKSHQATHDMLTGLPNRALFLTRALSALNDGGFAIVLLDLDRFKDVNDTLGHAIGDRLLCELSERLLRAVGEGATAARLGGDEFALVLPGISDPVEARAFVTELNAELARPVEMEGITLAVSASAGIALAPEHGDDVELLLQRADIAMYVAKERRSVVETYSAEHDQSMRRWLMLSGLLTHALETGTQLSVMYQPIADVRSGAVVQVEALTRWTHPEHGSIPPDEFISIAEQTGMISAITDFVLAEGCAQLAKWRQSGIDVGLAVNVSGREFADDSLVERVAGYLRTYDIAPSSLTLEVTETEIVSDLTQASAVLDALSRLGVRIGIDDYGTGHSSLAYIHRLPVQELKIDRSFVTDLPFEESNRIIVRSSIAMANSLGLSVVAEGAEDEATCALLADAGCDQIQGYYLSRPKSPSDLEEWLTSGGSLEFTPLPSTRRVRNHGLMLVPGGGTS